MLSAFRKFAGTWPARIFFLVLVGSFASWGIADVIRNLGGASGAVASVAGHDITPQQFMSEYQADVRRYSERLPDPSLLTQDLRVRLARQTLEKLVTQAALADEVRAMGVAAPDSQVRAEVYGMKQFQGVDGKFSEDVFKRAMAENNLTEARFLDLVRQDMAQNQLLQSVATSAGASDLMTRMVFDYLKERRRADLVAFGFAGQLLPPAPDEAVLKRYYTNNPTRYTSPEYRHVRIVILSPDTIGRGLTIPDADLQAWFKLHKADYVSEEKRSLQVITTGSADVAARLAAQWRAGADWDAMQAAAKGAGATTVPLDNATVKEVPSPELAKAAFAAQEGQVVGPVTEPLGSYVLKVTSITPAKNPSFESLRDEIHAKVAAEKAADLVEARAQKLQDLFAGGAKIDEVPADLGAAGAAGTLDAQGNTPEGTPAPIPAQGDARQLIIDAAFKTNPGDPIQPTEGPDHFWYAVAVDSITKPARKPFEKALPDVTNDWRRDQVRHAQEEKAAHLLSIVKGGVKLTSAVWGTGEQVVHTEPLVRGKPQFGLPAELVQTLFSMQPGEATMTQTDKGFLVVQLTDVLKPDPASDSAGFAEARQGLNSALHDDYLQIYAAALRDAAKPVVRPQIVQNLIAQPGE
jgi:peptidyl-prolyl cis-trans isomerase D